MIETGGVSVMGSSSSLLDRILGIMLRILKKGVAKMEISETKNAAIQHAIVNKSKIIGLLLDNRQVGDGNCIGWP